MTVEIHAKLITLLAQIDELKSKEAALKSEKQSPLGANDATYGHILQLRPVTVLKITGWHGERIRSLSSLTGSLYTDW